MEPAADTASRDAPFSRLEQHPTVVRFRERQALVGQPEARQPLEADWLRQLCLDAGADDVGFVEMARPEIADQGDDILAVFPYAQTLVSFVCRMNRDNIRTPARSIANLEFHHTTDHTNEVARRIVAALGERGVRAMNGGAVGFPMEMDRFPGKVWVVSHKPIAVGAGLGRMGIHRNVIHPRFGNFILLGTVVSTPPSTATRRPSTSTRASNANCVWPPAPPGPSAPTVLRLLRLLHPQLPRVHGRLRRLGRASGSSVTT